MEWWAVLTILGVIFLFLLFIGLPVAFTFFVTNIVGLFLFVGTSFDTLSMLVRSSFNSVSSFVYIAVPFFILLGEVVVESGLSNRAIKALDYWIGRMPARLCIQTIVGGTVFAAISGTSFASTAVLGSMLQPEMKKAGYPEWLSSGTILSAAMLAPLIPPSNNMIILAGIAMLPAGLLLIGGIMPGLMISVGMILMILVLTIVRPNLAPKADLPPQISWQIRINSLKDLIPVAVIMVAVIGTIMFGFATPAESASLGALASIVLAAFYKRLSFKILKSSLLATISITGMTLFIITNSSVFSQILAYSGAIRGFLQFCGSLGVSPIFIMSGFVVGLLIAGCFIDQVSLMLISVPIVMPTAQAFGFDPIWAALLIMVGVNVGGITPPFGLSIFVFQGVCPDVKLTELYKGITFFVGIHIVTLALMIAFPSLILWLPAMLRKG